MKTDKPWRQALPLMAPLMLVTGLLLPSDAVANDPLARNPQSPWYGLDKPAGWHFDLGVGLGQEPTYAGSSKSNGEFNLLARALYKTERGHRYSIGLGEFGATFTINPTTQFNVFLEFEEGRDSADDPALTGMDSIDSTVEGQFVLARRFGNTSVFAVLQPDLLGKANKGLVWFVGAGHDVFLKNNRWRLATRLDLSGANAEYMRTEFGVTAQEATRTGYSQYQPGGGLKSLTLGLNAEYFFSKRFSLLGAIEAEHYLSKAADSPLIAGPGRKTTFETSLLLRWQF
jgi:outer membrane scaffolding protein for murein synthesis (MipA/OmpV family)